MQPPVNLNPPEDKTPSPVAFTCNSWESPLATLRLVGPASLAGMELIKGNEGGQTYPERVASGQLVVLQRDFPAQAEDYTSVMQQARIHALPVVLDLDDLLLELPDDHPDRVVHYYTRALFPILQAIVEADAVTASSQPLCDYLKRYNPNVWLLPNYLDDRHWHLAPPRSKKPDDRPVQLAYMGGSSHTPDLEMITPVLLRLAEKYAETIQLRFFGVAPAQELLSFPNVEYVPLAEFNYARFADYFQKLEIDIFFAPLIDSLFNRCKSSIKFLEYSALGVPGVYSALTPYQVAVEHGKNGFLASNEQEWEQYLSRLIESQELRLELGQQAQATLREKWLLSEHAWQWREAYSQIISGKGKANPIDAQPLRLAFRLAQDLQASHTAKEKELLAWGREKDLTIQAVQETAEYLQEKYQEVLEGNQVLSRALHEMEKTVAVQKNEIEALQYQGNLLYSNVLSLTASLQEIYSSNAWKLVQGLWKLRLRFAPHGSVQARWMQAFLQTLLRLKRDGLSGWLHRDGQTLQAPSQDLPVEPAVGEPGPNLPAEAYGVRYEAVTQTQIANAGQDRPNQYDVIVLPIIDWNFRFQRPQQLAVHFARAGHRVFYAHTSMLNEQAPLVKWMQKNLFEVWLPSHGSMSVFTHQIDDQALSIMDVAFHALRKEFNIGDAVCMVDLPFWTPLAMRLRERYGWKIIYDCMDYHAGFSTNTSQQLSEEERLTRESDLVVVTSHLLHKAKSGQNPNLILVQNAGEFRHFRYPPIQAPQELRALTRPIIGYYGAIADWFDTALVKKLALARPKWSFVLIGRTAYADLKPIEGLQNVHLLGELPYSALPQYLHAFDVAFIPFKKIPLTDATNPVKLFEYMSAGKPVVATRLDELTYYQEYARLASGFEEWLEALEQALLATSSEEIHKRMEFARQNTWEQRFQEIDRAITRLFPLVSIILPATNQLDTLQLCLESIAAKTSYPNLEIIVVDPGSQEDTAQLVNTWSETQVAGRVRYHRAGRSDGSGLNLGASLAGGEILVFLDSNSVVTPGWLPRLVKHLSNSQVGAASALTNAIDTECHWNPEYETLQQLDKFATQLSAAQEGESVEIRTLDFGSAAMRRSVFLEVGSIHPSSPAADIDFSQRLRGLGYQLICAHDVFIHRWEGVEVVPSLKPHATPQVASHSTGS